MTYDLIRYIPLLEANDRRPRSPEWAVYYRVPDDSRIHVVFVRAADVTEAIARAAVEANIAAATAAGTH